MMRAKAMKHPWVAPTVERSAEIRGLLDDYWSRRLTDLLSPLRQWTARMSVRQPTLESVRESLEMIRQMAKDGLGPHAHCKEDQLFAWVLSACANGDPDAPEMARIALCSRAIEFDRWFE